MARILTDAARARYAEDGYWFPLDVLTPDEVAAARAALERFEAAQGHPVAGAQRSKSHLLFTWVDALIRHPRILDAVEDLIGPDILCWNTLWWIKEPGSDAFVSWHQDLRYWGLDTSELVTVWLALSPATRESGCMRVLPGSHRGELLPHRDEYKDANLLTRGQEIAVPIDESRTVAMELRPGQASFHNVRLAHASAANRSRDRRIGLSMHYIPTSARQLAADWDTASLVRGEDRYGHFTLAPRPAADCDAAAQRAHAEASGAFRDILFKDAERVRQTL
jgi:ectoine hydroxylase-related dioxygenase (phytanoyl-CoA dioxygenase family)